MLRFFKYWLPVVVWMAVIFGLSTNVGSAANTSRIIESLLRWLFPTISSGAMTQAHTFVRKTAHLGEYAVLGLLLWRALKQTGRRGVGSSRWKVAAAVVLMSAAYAATDEFHQSFVPTRGASVRDVGIDTCGTLIGLALGCAWTNRRRTTTDAGLQSERAIER
jgi:VanZ family protein